MGRGAPDKSVDRLGNCRYAARWVPGVLTLLDTHVSVGNIRLFCASLVPRSSLATCASGRAQLGKRYPLAALMPLGTACLASSGRLQIAYILISGREQHAAALLKDMPLHADHPVAHYTHA